MNFVWYQHNALKYFLSPLSLLYRTVITIRHFFYRIGIFKSHRVNVPVIVVGNITVGGTGKTPLVVALALELKRQGFLPGIILRGYGGKSKNWPQFVDANSDPMWVGDEAVLLALKTHLPVMAGPNRVLSAKKLIVEHHCDVIVSDDGLQHYALARDIEIAVVDSSRRFGNGWCLPAGPLREPVSRLQSVDFIVSNGEALGGEFEMQFVVDSIENLTDHSKKIDLIQCRDKKILAIAGIGNPDRFFDTLRKMDVVFESKAFLDHHHFQQSDFDDLNADIILMTEKDAVKCRDFADDRFFVVRGRAAVSDALLDTIKSKI